MTAFDDSLCDAINAYWAARGRQANARVGVHTVLCWKGWTYVERRRPLSKETYPMLISVRLEEPEHVTETAIISDIDPRWPDEPAGNQLRGVPERRGGARTSRDSSLHSPAVATVAAGTFSGGGR